MNLCRGNPDIAIKMCEKSPGPLSNVLRAGIQHRDADEETLKRIVRQAIRAEKPVLTEGLSTLGMLAPVAMFTGLLGTVLGMKGSFGALIEVQTKQIAHYCGRYFRSIANDRRRINCRATQLLSLTITSEIRQIGFSRIREARMSLVRFLATGEYKLFQEEYGDIRELKRVED